MFISAIASLRHVVERQWELRARSFNEVFGEVE